MAKKLGLVKGKITHMSVGFRLPQEDVDMLNRITKEVNALSRARISRNVVMQALLHYGDATLPAEQVFEWIKEIM